MSEFKIKVGLELEDDIKELIHKEIVKQLQEYQNSSVVTYGDNYIWTSVYENRKSSAVKHTDRGVSFYINNNEAHDEIEIQHIINKLNQEVNILKTEVNGLVRDMNKKL